jgi:hypothetical protein
MDHEVASPYREPESDMESDVVGLVGAFGMMLGVMGSLAGAVALASPVIDAVKSDTPAATFMTSVARLGPDARPDVSLILVAKGDVDPSRYVETLKGSIVRDYAMQMPDVVWTGDGRFTRVVLDLDLYDRYSGPGVVKQKVDDLTPVVEAIQSQGEYVSLGLQSADKAVPAEFAYSDPTTGIRKNVFFTTQ